MVVAVSPVDATRVAVAPAALVAAAADVRTAVPAAAAPALLVAANNANKTCSALPANQPQSGAFVRFSQSRAIHRAATEVPIK